MCCIGCISTERPQSTTINNIQEYTPMAEQFSSFTELKKTLDDYKTDGRLDSSSLKYVSYINIIDSRDFDIPVSKISVSIGSVGVYYDFPAKDSSLIKKYQSEQDEKSVLVLSYLRVITRLNVDPLPKNVLPNSIKNNLSLFNEMEKDGQTYYVSALQSFKNELIGWEIFWVRDGIEIGVGIPVTMGLDEGLNICQNSIIKYEVFSHQ